MEFVEHDLVWQRLRKQGVVECEPPAAELHLDLDASTDAADLDVAAVDHPAAASLGGGVLRIPRAEFGAVVEGILHKLRIAEFAVVPVGLWRQVFEVVAEPMCRHEQWRDIDSAATVELNTRDPLVASAAHLHLVRDLVDSVATRGTYPTQGLTIAALGVRLLIEVLPAGQMIVIAGDRALAAVAGTVVSHHAAPGAPATPTSAAPAATAPAPTPARPAAPAKKAATRRRG